MLCIQHTGSSTEWSTATFPISWNENKPCPRQALVFTFLQCKSFKNCGRRRNCSSRAEIAPHEQILHLPQCFLFGELFAIFIKFQTIVCKPFHFRGVQNLSYGKGLNKIIKHSLCFRYTFILKA